MKRKTLQKIVELPWFVGFVFSPPPNSNLRCSCCFESFFGSLAKRLSDQNLPRVLNEALITFDAGYLKWYF